MTDESNVHLVQGVCRPTVTMSIELYEELVDWKARAEKAESLAKGCMAQTDAFRRSFRFQVMVEGIKSPGPHAGFMFKVEAYAYLRIHGRGSITDTIENTTELI